MNDMTHIPYSPPYCPLDKDAHEIWAILVSLNEPYTEVKVFDYIPNQKLDVEINKQRKVVDLSWAFPDSSDDIRIIREKLKQLLK